MKKILVLLFITVALSSCKQAQQQPIDDNPMSGYMLGEDDYTKRVRGFMKAYTDNNLDPGNSIFSDDAVFFSKQHRYECSRIYECIWSRSQVF
jgi:hypothetical protein